MGDTVIMSKKELRRKTILDEIIRGRLKIIEASSKLSVCSKTVSRSLKRYKDQGTVGLTHKSRGKPSNRSTPTIYKESIIKIYEEKYLGFGPTFASEKLCEDDGLTVVTETLRLWLKNAGLWSRHRKRKGYRSHRARRPRFGELLQLDGSIHAWFEGIQKKQCLMNMVDDATGKTLALMDYGETTRSALSLLKWWIKDAGIPAAIYVDLKSLYVSPKSLREKIEYCEELIEPEWLTHFSSACSAVNVVPSKSPMKYCVPEPPFGAPGFILINKTHFSSSVSPTFNLKRSGHSQTPPCDPLSCPKSLKYTHSFKSEEL
jgi:transposase